MAKIESLYDVTGNPKHLNDVVLAEYENFILAVHDIKPKRDGKRRPDYPELHTCERRFAR
jgi:hypothetical protein